MRPLNFSPVYAQDALNRAQQSVIHAANALKARLLMTQQEERLNYWSGLFVNSPVIVATCIFFLAVAIEIIFSLPMYLDLMAEMTGTGNYFNALIGASLIVLWGAGVSHYIGKWASLAIFDYNIANKMHFSEKNALQAAVEEDVRMATSRDFIIGLGLGAALLFVVIGVSWQRVWLIGEITGGNYSLINKLLPVICVILEMISGIYLGYVYSRARRLILKKKYTQQYWDEKSQCAYQTNMAAEYYHKAVELGEPIHFNRELKDALFRNEFRSIDQDDYIEPVPAENVLKVIVKDGQSLISGVHLYGVTANGETCNRTYTNEFGEGILIWSGDQKALTHLFADGELYKGPFLENTTAVITLRRIKKIRVVNS